MFNELDLQHLNVLFDKRGNRLDAFLLRRGSPRRQVNHLCKSQLLACVHLDWSSLHAFPHSDNPSLFVHNVSHFLPSASKTQLNFVQKARAHGLVRHGR